MVLGSINQLNYRFEAPPPACMCPQAEWEHHRTIRYVVFSSHSHGPDYRRLMEKELVYRRLLGFITIITGLYCVFIFHHFHCETAVLWQSKNHYFLSWIRPMTFSDLIGWMQNPCRNLAVFFNNSECCMEHILHDFHAWNNIPVGKAPECNCIPILVKPRFYNVEPPSYKLVYKPH